jgi:hypothetical protein
MEARESTSEGIAILVVYLLVGDLRRWVRFCWGGASEDGDVVIAGRDCSFEKNSCDVCEMCQYGIGGFDLELMTAFIWC